MNHFNSLNLDKLISHTWLDFITKYHSSIIVLDLDMKKNKPVALSCEWCWTDPFASVVELSSKNYLIKKLLSI